MVLGWQQKRRTALGHLKGDGQRVEQLERAGCRHAALAERSREKGETCVKERVGLRKVAAPLNVVTSYTVLRYHSMRTYRSAGSFDRVSVVSACPKSDECMKWGTGSSTGLISVPSTIPSNVRDGKMCMHQLE